MIKSATKQVFLRGYRQLLHSAAGFRLYNTLFESSRLPSSIRNRLVMANRHIHPEELGSRDYTLRLISSGRNVSLPPIRTLSQWQFAQSYRWATPFYAELIRRLLASKPTGLWIDIGANHGIRCLDAHDAGWKVWAYEPNAEALAFYGQLIERNPWLNREGDRQVRAAVGNQEGELMLDIDASSYLSSVRSVSKPSGFHLARSETVPCLRMDQEFDLHQAEAADVIAKIDVEGFELAVLEGFGSRLRQLSAVLVEVSSSTVLSVCKFLEDSGFCLVYIDDLQRELVPLPDAVFPPDGTFDLLAWPKASSCPMIA